MFLFFSQDIHAGLVEDINLRVTWVGRLNQNGMCDGKVCDECVTSWREQALQRLNPLLDTVRKIEKEERGREKKKLFFFLFFSVVVDFFFF